MLLRNALPSAAVLGLLTLALLAVPARAQGVTTAALAGAVLDAGGEAIIGGSVVATTSPRARSTAP